MADVLKAGFGSTASGNLTAGVNECIFQTIPSPSAGAIHITSITPMAIQVGGVFKNPAYIAVFVVRGAKGSSPVRPGDPSLLGLPTQKQLSDASLEMLWSGYWEIQSQGGLWSFEPGELSAKDGQVLIVTTNGLIDGTTNTPTVLGGVCALATLGREESTIVRMKAR